MYQHQYYLNTDEYKNSEEMIHTNLEPPSKVPKTFKDYNDLYEYVLQSARTILKYKYLQATQQETDAGVALFNNTKLGKVTLHYDTTSRSNTDGEWPSLILIFNNRKSFHLRSLLFAYEDRENICRLTKETLERFSSAVALIYSRVITAKDLWENITHIRTDSVDKNLKIEDLVAEKLGSKHIPYHLL